MYEFLDRLVSVAIPRIRDFRGLNAKSFDGRGNYSMGIKEQIIFPEIENISIANHTFLVKSDSLIVHPIMVYKSKTTLSDSSKQKLQLWLQKRLSKEKIEIYKQDSN